jgi:hypothetical protein
MVLNLQWFNLFYNDAKKYILRKKHSLDFEFFPNKPICSSVISPDAAQQLWVILASSDHRVKTDTP